MLYNCFMNLGVLKFDKIYIYKNYAKMMYCEKLSEFSWGALCLD